MKKKILEIFALIAVLLLLPGCSPEVDDNLQGTACDTVIYGTVFVGEASGKTVEAIAVKDGIIVYAGDKEGAKAYEVGAGEVIQLTDDEFALPGIVDAHSHPAVAWDEKINSLMLKEDWTMEQYIEEITKFVKDNPDAVVYRVKGYVESNFITDEQKNNPKAILDAICSDVPIVVTDGGGHGMWCNSKAIEMVCEKNPTIKMVDSDNPGHDNVSAPGGTIERNSEGEAIGFFRDKGVTIVNKACVEFTKEGYVKAILKAQEEFSSMGYTAYDEAMINESADITKTPKIEAYNELEEEGKLTCYVAGSFIVGNRDDALELVDQAIKYRDETKGGNFEVTNIKIFMDGVVEGGSAYLSEPYEHNIDGSEAGDYRGSSSWSNNLDRLTEVIIKANSAGMAVHFHSVGDQASMDVLTCIENAAKVIGVDKVREARNVITHLQILDESCYDKFKEYNVIANLNPWACKTPGFYNETEVMCLGEERASNEYPYKTFMDKGIRCSFGTDYGSSFTYHLNESLLKFTARKYATISSPEIDDSTVLNPSEAFTPAEALTIMCSGGAYQLHKENEFGLLEEGMDANLVILNINPLTAEEQDIMSIESLKTMFEGDWVYGKSTDENKEEITGEERENTIENDSHSEISKVTDYLFKVTYNNYEDSIDEAKAYFLKYKPQLGGCSSVQNGMIRGRNYDWTVDEAPEFVIHVPATENRHASIGVATTTAITAEQVESGEELDMYKYIPYFTLDGINDAGLTININVVGFGEKGEFVMKTEDESDDICPLMVSRLVLDNAGSIDEALALIEKMDIFSLGTQEECHFMISGPQSASDDTFNTVVVEFIPDENKHYQISVIDNAKGDFVDNKVIMTNFHLTGFDGSIESLTEHPMGYERYLILADAYEQGATVAGMKDLMKKVYFTKAYDPYSNMIWYSEFAEGDLTMRNRGEARINGDYSKAGAYAEVLKSECDNYVNTNMNRKSEEKGWHTVHTSVYDIENKTLSVLPQEAGFSYDFLLEE